MTLPITAKVNKNGHLEVGGCDMVSLAEQFGTPLYVIDETNIRAKAQAYTSALKKNYPDSQVIFATKALSVVGILKVFANEGLGFDVSSGGELFTAIKAGVNIKNVYLHGNNKTKQEIEEALDAEVGRIVVDSIDELVLLDEITKETGIKANVLLRINPGVEAHTHEHIRTGQTDSKFGIQKDKVIEAVAMANKMRNVNFIGLHAHIGSQILKVKGYLEEISVLLEHARHIRDSLNIEIKELNIGGGIGISYTDETTPDIAVFIKEIADKLNKGLAKYGLKKPRLILEPGRSLVGDAGLTLYSVGNIKEISGIRKFISVDGGMGDNIRPSLYKAKYQAVAANKMNDKDTEKITMAGRYCESGDVLISDVKLPKVVNGDVIAVLCTGAYGYSMASNYNRVPRPAMVLVKDGNAKLILKRETYDDIVRNDIL